MCLLDYAASSPKGSDDVQSSEKAGSILGLWWFLWVVTNILGHAVFRMSTGAEELQELMNLNIIRQVSDLLAISLALVTLSIINSISQAQSVVHESANK